MYSILEQKEVEVSGVGGVLRARRKEGPRKGNTKDEQTRRERDGR